jgi:hypothetical protein
MRPDCFASVVHREAADSNEPLMVLWLLLGTLYVVLFFMLGLTTFRKRP